MMVRSSVLYEDVSFGFFVERGRDRFCSAPAGCMGRFCPDLGTAEVALWLGATGEVGATDTSAEGCREPDRSSRYCRGLEPVSSTTGSACLSAPFSRTPVTPARPSPGNLLSLLHGFLQPSNGPRNSAEKINNPFPLKYDSANLSTLRRFAARPSSSSSSSEPSSSS